MMDLHSQGSQVKKALQEKVRLDDGRYGYVITELVAVGNVPRWHCHVCGKTISSERALHIHLSHPIHNSNLRVSKHPPSNFKKFSNKPNGSPREGDGKDAWTDHATSILPGEPIPPGMEDLVDGSCQIQKTLDAFKSAPLIGLEYIVELVNQSGEGEPRYACLLCEKRGDPRSVIVHLTSQNHYLKYISCFFRSAGNALNMQQRTPEIRKGIYVAVNKVAEQIEKHYGRLKPISAVAETFSSKKFEILREIDEKEHFRETPNTSFLDLVHPDKIKKYAIEEESRLKAQLTKVEVPVFHSKHDKGSKSHNSKGPPPLTNPPKKAPPPLTNPPKSVPPPLANLPKVVPPPLKNQPQPKATKDIKNEKKLVFQIGKPEKSFGRNKASDSANKGNDQSNNQEDDDDVIFVGDNIGECIEVKSLSSISSTSDNGSPGRNSLKRRRSRSIDRYNRRRSPDRKGRRKSPSYDSYSRSRRSRSKRSRSHSRDRYRMDRRHRRSRSRRRYDDRYSQERRKAFSRDRTPDRRRSPPRRRDKSPERKIAKNEWQSKIDRNYRWDKYRAELKKLEMEYDEKLKYYEDRPEKHPSYSEEWKNYWNKKYKEIQQTGKDPSNYDFKPEWIVFWGKRMKEINETEFEKKREELTKEMGVDGIRAKGPSSELQDISPPTPDDAKDVTVDDIRNTWKALTGSEISAPPDKEERRPLSPWENNDRKFYDKPYDKPYDKSYEKPNKKYNTPSFPISTPVVHCLRMLSVLENQLGSLGPKVLDLLSQALALERSKEGDSMTMLEDRDNHIFFDTVKEKVRGQLLAGIVERGLVNSCYSVIGAIENMLRTNPPRPKRHFTKSPPVPKEVPAQISEPVQVHGIGMIDKIAVAQQIAGALIAQGKTDVTQEELEGLINAVVGIAQASNATVNQDTSTVDFFSQLNLKNSTANSHINELLGSMISTVQKTTVQAETPPPPPLPPNPEPVVLPPPPEPEPVVTEKEDNDEDLKEKLMNFSNLPREEQQELIKMLKDLESTQPERVEGLRKYVTIGLAKKSETKTNETKAQSPTENFEQDEEQVNNVPSDDEDDDDDDDYSFEDVYKAASEKLKTKEPSQEKNYNTFEDSNSRGSHLSTKMVAEHSGILTDKDASQMSISSDRAIPLDDFFSKMPLTRPPFPPMNSRLSFSDESNFGALGQQNAPFRGERSNFGFPGGESNQFNQNYPQQQNWNYTEQVQYPVPPPVPQNQFVPGNQNFSPMNFNQPPPRNFGNYYGNY